MPLVYRSMLPDGDLPMLGAGKKYLGAVIGSGDNDDIQVDENGHVQPQTGGMSVANHWTSLPQHRIPHRLNKHVHAATGNNSIICWAHGNGTFMDAEFSNGLTLRVDHPRHACVEPDSAMTAEDYQAAIAATQPDWRRDEEPK